MPVTTAFTAFSDWIVDMHSCGKSRQEIAAECGCPLTMVHDVLRVHARSTPLPSREKSLWVQLPGKDARRLLGKTKRQLMDTLDAMARHKRALESDKRVRMTLRSVNSNATALAELLAELTEPGELAENVEPAVDAAAVEQHAAA